MRASSPLFVGRQDELSRVEALLDGARSGRAAAVLITGDAGIGKTRFTDELARRAEAVDAVVLRGGCVDLGDGALPHAPFVQMLRDLVRRQGIPAVLEHAGPTGDELSRLAPELAVGGRVPEASRASTGRLYQALACLLEGLARRRPLVVVVEDVHWADQSTRDLVLLLAHSLPSRSLLLVTSRTDELADEPAARRFTTQLARVAHVQELHPFDRAEQARQISGIVGVPPSTALVDVVFARAEGNPFFAEEILAFDPASEEVPATVRALALARADALPEATQRVLRAAAAAGRGVTHRLLAAVTDMDEDALDQALRHAVAGHVLVAESAAGGSYRFRHALQQEAISGTLLPGERARLHRRLAGALTADRALAGPVGSGVAGRIALHWHAAGDERQSLVASLRAAAEAEEALAFPTALAGYERVIALLDVVPDADALLDRPRYQVLWAAAEAAHLAALPDRATQLVRAAIAACEEAASSPTPVSPDRGLHHAYLHERLGRYLWMTADGSGSAAAYRRAVQLAPTESPTCWRAAILSGYAQSLMLTGRFAESIPYCHEAIALSRHPDVEAARSTEGHARNNLGVNLAFLGDVEAGIAELRLARQIAEEEFDDVDDIARAIVNLDTVLFDAGRLAEAAEAALEGIAVVDRLGLKRRKGVWCRADAADTLVLLGRCDEARQLLDEALALAPDGIDRVRVAEVRGRLHLHLGELEEARRHLDEARQSGIGVTDGQIIGPLYATMIEVAAWRGCTAEALELAEEACERLDPDAAAAFSVPVHTAAARAAVDAQRDAATWVARAEEAVARDAVPKPAPAAALQTARAELSRGLGRNDPDAWEEAAGAWQRLSVPYRCAYARWRQAEAILLAAGDRDGAVAAVRAGLETAERIRARHLHEKITALAGRARLDPSLTGRPRPGRTTPFQLTARELEVLELVAEGRSDRQIGEALFISHRTVERHVSNILAKAGAQRRAELAAMAHRTGLAAAAPDGR